MGLFSTLISNVRADLTTRSSLVSSNLSVLTSQIGTTIGEVAARVVSDPIGTLQYVVNDTKIAIFGHNGPLIARDAVSFVEGLAGLTADTALNIFNALPTFTQTPVYENQVGAIKKQEGSITEITSKFTTGASIGDLSWLIYKGRMVSNTEITDKWKLYSEAETTHGYNSRIYVDAANKQVAITLEGTQANSDLSPLWLSKDGLADLEIGLGVIPPQMREGYEQFKVMVADVTNKFGTEGYGISVAGHSLGGGLAEMMSGMYFIDTGIALPTMAQAGPGMLNQLKLYAEQQLLAGKSIHLPSGNVVSLHSLTTLGRADEAKAIVSTFKAQDFSHITNLITVLDPVGAVNYNIDPEKDGHIGLNMIVPYLLTTREDMQDLEAVVIDPVNRLNLTTSSDLPGVLSGLSNISATRFDRHEPDQSIALWSGTAVGFKDQSLVGVGTAVFRQYEDPRQVWEGSKLSLPEVTVFGTSANDLIQTKNKATQVLAGDGDDYVTVDSVGSLVSGGNGNDYLFGGAGDDYLAGDAGNDYLSGGAGNDILYGGAGNDVLDGGAGADILCGGAGEDVLVWSAGNDILCGNEGNDTLVVRNGVSGQSSMKWERNFTNFGNDVVEIEGAMAAGSSLLFNFADEIRFADMQWKQNGNDIVMVDKLGTAEATVTFKDAFAKFGQNQGKMEFQFTNGRLYLDDELYSVEAGSGTITASADAKHKGSIMVGSAGADTLVSGKGNDVMFGGAGADKFVFGNTFGTDKIIGSDRSDVVAFSNVFNSAEYTVAKSGNDLVISYQQSGLSTVSSVTVADWYATGEHVNTFSFNNVNYTVDSNNKFVKK